MRKSIADRTAANEAFATSGGYGTTMDEAGRSHIFSTRARAQHAALPQHQRNGGDGGDGGCVATAFSIMDEADIQTASRAAGAKIWLVMPDGSLQTIG